MAIDRRDAPARNKARTGRMAAKGSFRYNPSVVKEENKNARQGVKQSTNPNAQATKSTSSSNSVRTTKSVSPRRPSMPVKTGVKNKMKAQGAKINSSATSRLSQGRRGK